MFAVFGVVLSLWIDLGMYLHYNYSINWRFPLAFQIVFCAIVLIFIVDLPESPRWLLKHGRADETRTVLSALDDLERESPSLDEDISDILTSLERSKAGHLRSWLKGDKRYALRLGIAVAVQCFNQLCGIDVISYYAGKKVRFGASTTDALFSNHLRAISRLKPNSVQSHGCTSRNAAVGMRFRSSVRRGSNW